MLNCPGHFVAIFGSGIAGSEAAYQLSKRGIYSVIFEQHALPYGKIEEGLPKWHIKLRNQEEKKIDNKLTQPGVFFVPKTRLGSDFTISQICDWGFSAIILAVGAWRDRSLPIQNIDNYIGRGLYYQNMFVSWFNHNHESKYEDSKYEIPDNAIVIGGGLASLDVVKIIMLETTLKSLKEKGCKIDLFRLEKVGIKSYLNDIGLSLEELGLKGCTLYYRKRIIDMPLTPMPRGVSPERLEKVYQLRKRILKNYQDKYLFQVKERHIPSDKLVKNGCLIGIVFKKADLKMMNNYNTPQDKVNVKTPLVISSIGSIPEIPDDIPIEKDLFAIENPDTGQLKEFNDVFVIGNAVSGRGNIQESLANSRITTQFLIDDFFDYRGEEIKKLISQRENDSVETIKKIEKKLHLGKKLSPSKISKLTGQIRERQRVVGYNGHYHQWIINNLPIRLENLKEYQV